MNTHQMAGTSDDLTGNVQEEAGEFMGSLEQGIDAIRKQVTGRAEQRYGDAKTIAEDAKDAIRHGNHQR